MNFRKLMIIQYYEFPLPFLLKPMMFLLFWFVCVLKLTVFCARIDDKCGTLRICFALRLSVIITTCSLCSPCILNIYTCCPCTACNFSLSPHLFFFLFFLVAVSHVAGTTSRSNYYNNRYDVTALLNAESPWPYIISAAAGGTTGGPFVSHANNEFVTQIT